MKYLPKIYAQSLVLALGESDYASRDKIFDNFINILKDNRDVLHFSEIEKEISKIITQKNNPKSLTCVLAHEIDLSDETIVQLKKLISNNSNPSFSFNKDIIGGIIVKYDDNLIDASVKHQLLKLRDNLTS